MADLKDFNRGLKAFERDMVRAMAQATRAATAVLVEEMEGLASSIDHSLEDLRRLGHPYGIDGRPKNEPHVDWIVHEQSGDLLGSIGGAAVTVTPDAVLGGVHVTDRKAAWLILGTPTMRPRDFVSAALIYQEAEVSAIYQKAHAKVHDEPGDQAVQVEVTLGEHGGFPAELPERG